MIHKLPWYTFAVFWCTPPPLTISCIFFAHSLNCCSVFKDLYSVKEHSELGKVVSIAVLGGISHVHMVGWLNDEVGNQTGPFWCSPQFIPMSSYEGLLPQGIEYVHFHQFLVQSTYDILNGFEFNWYVVFGMPIVSYLKQKPIRWNLDLEYKRPWYRELMNW